MSRKTRKPKKTAKRARRAKVPPAPAPDILGEVMARLLAGESEHSITLAISAKYPAADIPALLSACLSSLANSATCPVPVLIGWCFEATRELYRRMVEIGDYPGALRAVKQVKELSANVFERDEDDEEKNEAPRFNGACESIHEKPGASGTGPGATITNSP